MAKVLKPVTLADVTNGADDTYYYEIPNIRGFGLINLMGILNGGSGTVAVTIEATLDDVATYAEVANWIDVTALVASAANFTASFLEAILHKLAGFTFARLKVVASTGDADDADWFLSATSVAFEA